MVSRFSEINLSINYHIRIRVNQKRPVPALRKYPIKRRGRIHRAGLVASGVFLKINQIHVGDYFWLVLGKLADALHKSQQRFIGCENHARCSAVAEDCAKLHFYLPDAVRGNKEFDKI